MLVVFNALLPLMHFCFISSDCSFTTHHVYITVRVPIRKQKSKIELFELIKVPFQYEDSKCILDEPSQYVALHNDRVVEITGNMRKHCDIGRSGLCYIPPFERDSSGFGTCAKKILKGATAVEIRKSCTFTCQKNSEILINTINATTIAVTNAKYVSFICEDKGRIVYNITSNTGLLAIKIPCHCKLLLDNATTSDAILPPFPCGTENDIADPHVVTKVPAVWSTLR
jgi:hypothetical protein